jgi:hypothetical protein
MCFPLFVLRIPLVPAAAHDRSEPNQNLMACRAKLQPSLCKWAFSLKHAALRPDPFGQLVRSCRKGAVMRSRMVIFPTSRFGFHLPERGLRPLRDIGLAIRAETGEAAGHGDSGFPCFDLRQGSDREDARVLFGRLRDENQRPRFRQ